jgi:hypothetical protein
MIQSATQPPRYGATHADANAPRVHDWTKMRRKKEEEEKRTLVAQWCNRYICTRVGAAGWVGECAVGRVGGSYGKDLRLVDGLDLPIDIDRVGHDEQRRVHRVPRGDAPRVNTIPRSSLLHDTVQVEVVGRTRDVVGDGMGLVTSTRKIQEGGWEWEWMARR